MTWYYIEDEGASLRAIFTSLYTDALDPTVYFVLNLVDEMILDGIEWNKMIQTPNRETSGGCVNGTGVVPNPDLY